MSALYVLSSLKNRSSSHIWCGSRDSSRAQQVDGPSAVRVPTVLPLSCRDLIRSRNTHTNGGLRVCPRSSCRHLLCVGLRLFLNVVRFGARCLHQESVPYRRRQASHRMVRLEVCLERAFVETLLLELAVSAWSSLSSMRWLPRCA